MACLSTITTTAPHHHHHHHHEGLLVANSHTSSSNSTLSLSFLSSSSNHTSLPPIFLHRSFLQYGPYRGANPISPSHRCFAATPGPPPSPEPEPPFNENHGSSTGLEATLSRFQDRLQIFFAVLFWMSLFFWACAWDGRGDRPNKGSRFRK